MQSKFKTTSSDSAHQSAPPVSVSEGHDAATWWAAMAVVLPSLWWWTVTDRLDLPKSWIALVVATLGIVWLLFRSPDQVRSPLLSLPALAGIAMLLSSPGEMAARVEAWALLSACLGVGLSARSADPRRFGGLILWLAVVPLVLFAWIQALGVDLLTSMVQGFEGRRIFSTMGGPDHLGWMLAGLVPWWLAWWHRLPAESPKGIDRRVIGFIGGAALVGALAATGSRGAWAAAFIGLVSWLWLEKPSARRVVMLTAMLVVGLVAALVTDGMFHRARLVSRTNDVSDPKGRAAGRMYLVKVHGSCLVRDLASGALFGHGPEGFQRRWPSCQDRYLAAHPSDEHFRSDLRHAHLDLVELWSDYGIFGLAILAWLAWLLWRRRAWSDPGRRPALASLLALLTAGLSGWPLFFAPTAMLLAADMGLLASGHRKNDPGTDSVGPPEDPVAKARPRLAWVRRYWPGIFLAALLLVALALLSRRLVSEGFRSAATRARAAGRVRNALHNASQAVTVDSRNARAWIEYGLDLDLAGYHPEARKAWTKALRDLPSDAVRWRLDTSKSR